MSFATTLALALNLAFMPGEPVRSCQARILAYDGSNLPAGDEIRLSADPAALVLLGVQHSRDPAHPQNARIEQAFGVLRPDIVFYEGSDRGIRETRDETIAQTGESGLVRYLAMQSGAGLVRLEPDPREELLFVLEEFPLDQAVLFYLLRSAAQWREREALFPDQIDARMTDFLERVAVLLDSLPGHDGTISLESPDDLAALARQYWPDRDWREAPMSWFSPEARGSQTGGLFTNEINMRSSHYRNRVMFARIAERLLAGERIFAAVGGDHLPRLHPAFECLEAALREAEAP